MDVGFWMLREAIKYKVIEAGGIFAEVPTRKVKPSQTCPNCGHQKKKELSERIHSCSECGYIEDRDVAAAIVCLNYARGLERASLDAEQKALLETPQDCGGFKQLAARKRQKLRPQP